MPARGKIKIVTAASISKEISAAMKDALRALCEGWHGPDDPEQRTMVALAGRGLVLLRFADQDRGHKVQLRGDQEARRYMWMPTPFGREVYGRIRLAKPSVPVDWSKKKVRPHGKQFTSSRSVARLPAFR